MNKADDNENRLTDRTPTSVENIFDTNAEEHPRYIHPMCELAERRVSDNCAGISEKIH